MVMWQLWNGARCKFVKPQRAGFVEKLVRCTPVNFYKCFCRLFFVPNAFSMGHFLVGNRYRSLPGIRSSLVLALTLPVSPRSEPQPVCRPEEQSMVPTAHSLAEVSIRVPIQIQLSGRTHTFAPKGKANKNRSPDKEYRIKSNIYEYMSLFRY